MTDVEVQRDGTVTSVLGYKILDVIPVFRQGVAVPDVLFTGENRLLILPVAFDDQTQEHDAVAAVLVLDTLQAGKPAFRPGWLYGEHLAQKLIAEDPAAVVETPEGATIVVDESTLADIVSRLDRLIELLTPGPVYDDDPIEEIAEAVEPVLQT